MKSFKKTVLIAVIISLTTGLSVLQAGELTQNFVNPDFGGNPNNGGYLLSNATAINNYTAPSTATSALATSASTTASSNTPNTAQQFAAQVDRLVLSALANRMVNKAFGSSNENLSGNSSIDTGINTISVESTGSGTSVTITDNATGGRSVISIPNY